MLLAIPAVPVQFVRRFRHALPDNCFPFCFANLPLQSLLILVRMCVCDKKWAGMTAALHGRRGCSESLRISCGYVGVVHSVIQAGISFEFGKYV